MTNFNWVDYLFLALFLLSTLAGLLRGFLREIFALFVWVVAFVLGMLYATRLADYFLSSPSAQNMFISAADGLGMKSPNAVPMLAVGIGFICIFLGVLIVGKILGLIFSTASMGGGIGLINRLLGAIFGFARGVLIAIFIIFLVQMTPASNESWWGQSVIINRLQPTVNILNNSLEPGIESLKAKVEETLKNIDQKPKDSDEKETHPID